MSDDQKNVKILLAEDAMAMRKIEIKILNSLGYDKIVEANDGAHAMALLEEHPDVDLVISDWNMPNKSGLDLLIFMRANEKFKEIPFIMATAQSDKKQEKNAVDEGVTCFVPKPFSPGELQAKIDQALSGAEAPATDEKEKGPQMSDSGKVKLRMAHIQITDHLLLGVLKKQIESGQIKPQHFELDTRCMASWNPVSDALESGTIDGAFVLAPIAMDLFNYGAPIKMVLLAHKGGSIMVRNHQGDYHEPFQGFFKGKSFLIPHKMSIHHMLTHMFFKNVGLNASLDKGDDVDVNLEVVAPIRMPEFLADNSNNCGFMVAEPIGTKAIAAGLAELQFLSSELWKNHPCCVVTLRDEFIEAHPDAVHEFTRYMVEAGRFVENNLAAAAEIAVEFLDPDKSLGLKVPILKNVLSEEQGIKTGELYPSIEDLDTIQKYMVDTMGVGAKINLENFVDMRFADAAYEGHPVKSAGSTYNDSPAIAQDLLEPKSGSEAASSKSLLNKEGKYLTFVLGNQEFGVDILRVKEIIGFMDINALPQAHQFIKGVINLRDRVIPVMDLRRRFAMEKKDPTQRSCIIIIDSDSNGKESMVGITVDEVSEVATIKSDDIDEAPSFTSSIDTNYILAMAKFGEQVKILLNIDKVLSFQ